METIKAIASFWHPLFQYGWQTGFWIINYCRQMVSSLFIVLIWFTEEIVFTVLVVRCFRFKKLSCKWQFAVLHAESQTSRSEHSTEFICTRHRCVLLMFHSALLYGTFRFVKSTAAYRIRRGLPLNSWRELFINNEYFRQMRN